jgi:hypothetical protein
MPHHPAGQRAGGVVGIGDAKTNVHAMVEYIQHSAELQVSMCGSGGGGQGKCRHMAHHPVEHTVTQATKSIAHGPLLTGR